MGSDFEQGATGHPLEARTLGSCSSLDLSCIDPLPASKIHEID
ncbi:uncharacterized protein METZ01_LOCUS339486, partial [marine metagenome]